MKIILKALAAVYLGIFSVSSVCSEDVLNQLTSQELNDKASNTAAKSIDKEIKSTAYEPFKNILEEMGFDKVNILISRDEVTNQEEAMKNGVAFETGLKKAFNNLLDNARDKDSRKALKAKINKSDSVITIFDLSKRADRGESVASNWIFYLYSPRLSRNGQFIIIDKNGKNSDYNYSAFIAYYDPDRERDTYEPPELDINSSSAQSGIEGIFEGERIADQSGAERSAESVIGDIRNQGRILYNNYGAQFTMVKYDAWPKNIPIYGDFAEPYRNFLNNARKIDKTRISMRDRWIKLNEKTSDEKAMEVLADMKKMGREYDRLIGELLKYVRQGQQLYAEGRATFPSLLHSIKLVKGTQWIQLYDDEGKKIQKKTCTHWKYNNWNWFPFGGFFTAASGTVYVCDKWKMTDEKAEIPDYRLEYGYGGDQVYPHRARMMDVPPTPAFPEVFLQESVKRDQYDMEIVITCTLDKNPRKGWLISNAKLRKGKNTSSNSWGGGATAGGKIGVPLVVEGNASVNVNYSHTWNKFNFGEMVHFNEFVGKPCFELNKRR